MKVSFDIWYLKTGIFGVHLHVRHLHHSLLNLGVMTRPEFANVILTWTRFLILYKHYRLSLFSCFLDGVCMSKIRLTYLLKKFRVVVRPAVTECSAAVTWYQFYDFSSRLVSSCHPVLCPTQSKKRAAIAVKRRRPTSRPRAFAIAHGQYGRHFRANQYRNHQHHPQMHPAYRLYNRHRLVVVKVTIGYAQSITRKSTNRIIRDISTTERRSGLLRWTALHESGEGMWRETVSKRNTMFVAVTIMIILLHKNSSLRLNRRADPTVILSYL